MSENLIHITQCVVCGNRPRPFRIEAAGFEPIPAIGPIPKRAEEFGKRLFAHLYTEGQKEQAALQNGDGAKPPENLQEAAVYMMTRAAHLSAVRVINQTAEWSQRFALLAAYHTTDPALVNAREATRYALQQATVDRTPDPNDNDIEQTTEAILATLDRFELNLVEKRQFTQQFREILTEFRHRIIHSPPPEGIEPLQPIVQVARS